MPHDPASEPSSFPSETTDAAADSLLAQVRLHTVSGIGPRIRRRLVARFGSAEAVFDATSADLRAVEGVGPKLARKIVDARSDPRPADELAFCREQGIDVIVESDDAYPPLMREIHDPPGVLFLRGRLENPSDRMAVAIVGTRHATPYGRQQAERLGGALARAGLTVVSGLARGIDGAAHRGALQAGGRTIAVLAGGVWSIYPPEHATLAGEVAANGVLLSEVPPHAEPLPGMFPQRNRLISGLSLGVLVVEAAERSGALITAEHAMEQGREVFAVPGRIDQRTSRGCHRLLREGATLVESVDDILDQLGPLCEAAPRDDGPAIRHPAEVTLNDIERRVLDAVAVDPTPIDHVVTQTQLPISQVLSTISVLEMRRLIRRHSGGQVMRSS